MIRLVSYLSRVFRGDEADDLGAVERLLDLSPTLGLRALTRTRPRRVRSVAREWCSERLVLYARGFEALGRRRQALEALDSALGQNCWHGSDEDEVRRRRDALRAQLGST